MSTDVIVQSTIAGIALVALIVSIWFSGQTLKELREDRAARERPRLAFEMGTVTLPISLPMQKDPMPGWFGAALRALYPTIPADGRAMLLDDSIRDTGYGVLRNYGSGAAMQIRLDLVLDVADHRNFPRADH